MRNETRPRPHTSTTNQTAPCSDATQRRSARRRRSAQRVSDGVISTYIHDLTRRHRPLVPRPA